MLICIVDDDSTKVMLRWNFNDSTVLGENIKHLHLIDSFNLECGFKKLWKTWTFETHLLCLCRYLYNHCRVPQSGPGTLDRQILSANQSPVLYWLTNHRADQRFTSVPQSFVQLNDLQYFHWCSFSCNKRFWDSTMHLNISPNSIKDNQRSPIQTVSDLMDLN